MTLKKDEKKLIELIASGESYADAYAVVYPDSNKSKSTINVTVSRLLKKKEAQTYKEKCEQRLKEEKIKIKTEVSELIREKTVWSIQSSIDALQFVIDKATQDCLEIEKRNKTSDKYVRMMPNVTSSPIINAVSELNKLLGLVNSDSGQNKSELTNQFIDATDFNEDPEDYKAPPILEAQTGEDDE
jgi:hypothetical protein